MKSTKVLALLVAAVFAFAGAAFAQDAPKADEPKPVVDVSGVLYLDWGYVQKANEASSLKEGSDTMRLQRAYLNFAKKIDDMWSVKVTLDGVGVTTQEASIDGDEVDGDPDALPDDNLTVSNSTKANNVMLIKNAYVQGTFDPAFVLKVGAAGMPWTGYVEKYYGMRYVENTLTDRLKYANSADWGAHASGDLGNGFNYAVAVVNGAGYKNPSRSKGVDVEGRLAWEITPEFAVAVGGYSGYLGQEKQNNDAEKRYSRGDVMVAYAGPMFRLGGEYFTAKNLGQVQQTAVPAVGDKATGWSLWSSVRLAQTANGDVSVFGRYDKTDTSKTLNPFREDTYWNVGVEYPVLKNFKLAAVYKDTDATVGSLASPSQTKTKELGIWGDLKF